MSDTSWASIALALGADHDPETCRFCLNERGLCGERMAIYVCREPKGHDGPHYAGDLGEASSAWISL